MTGTTTSDRLNSYSNMGSIARWSFRHIYPFEIPILLYCLIGYLCARSFGFDIDWAVALDLSYDLVILRKAAVLSLAVVLLVYGVRMLRGEPWRDIGEDLYRKFSAYLHQWRDWQRWMELLRSLLAIKLCLLIYTHLKQAIPLLNPVLYDDQFWALDRWIHLGLSPTQLTLDTLSSPFMSRSIDTLYVLWYAIKAPFLVYFLFFATRDRRRHFLTCYVLLWMIGGGFAIWLPSLGPIYTNPELFTQVDMPLANVIQGKLWTHYEQLLANPEQYRFAIYDGVAAFPSLHVGIVVLFTVAIFQFRPLFWAMVSYSVIIQIGSVLLGWHYAVDGYFLAVLAVLIFMGVRPLLLQASKRGSPAGATHVRRRTS